MNQEEKQLLLKDLCARLPYKIRVKVSEVSYPVEFDVQMLAEIKNNNWYEYPIPYLRPMSSMTEEEKEEISQKLNYEFYIDEDAALCAEDERHRIRLDLIEVYIDWLNKNHFDYRGFIEKGLAIEAAEGMYNITK